MRGEPPYALKIISGQIHIAKMKVIVITNPNQNIDNAFVANIAAADLQDCNSVPNFHVSLWKHCSRLEYDRPRYNRKKGVNRVSDLLCMLYPQRLLHALSFKPASKLSLSF